MSSNLVHYSKVDSERLKFDINMKEVKHEQESSLVSRFDFQFSYGA